MSEPTDKDKEIAKLREVLRFYEQEVTAFSEDPHNVSPLSGRCLLAEDGGKRAREALGDE